MLDKVYGTIMDSFSTYLKEFRVNASLTQSKIIEQLKEFDEELSNIDNVTLSRWENNKTIPSLKKRVLILIALGLYEKAQELINENAPKINKPDLATKRFGKIFSGKDNLYVDIESITITREYQEAIPNKKIMYYLNLSNELYGNNLKKSQSLYNTMHEKTLYEFCTDSGLIVGHVIIGVAKTSDIKGFCKEKHHIISSFPNGDCIFLFSMYNSNIDIFIKSTKLIQEYIYKRLDKTRYVLSRSIFQDFSDFFDTANSKAICINDEIESPHGVSFRGKKYKWVMYTTKVEDFLLALNAYFQDSKQ